MIWVRVDADDMCDMAAFAGFGIRSGLRHDPAIICESGDQVIDAAGEVSAGTVRRTFSA